MFPGVGLQDGGVAVPGLPHDRVRIRPLPERFGDEPGPQRMPTQLRNLLRGVAGVCESPHYLAAYRHAKWRDPRRLNHPEGRHGPIYARQAAPRH